MFVSTLFVKTLYDGIWVFLLFQAYYSLYAAFVARQNTHSTSLNYHPAVIKHANLSIGGNTPCSNISSVGQAFLALPIIADALSELEILLSQTLNKKNFDVLVCIVCRHSMFGFNVRQ